MKLRIYIAFFFSAHFLTHVLLVCVAAAGNQLDFEAHNFPCKLSVEPILLSPM